MIKTESTNGEQVKHVLWSKLSEIESNKLLIYREEMANIYAHKNNVIYCNTTIEGANRSHDSTNQWWCYIDLHDF